MPMAGLTGSDLMRYFKTVTDPYTGQAWVAIPAIKPDWAILHVHAADEEGNIWIRGARYDDILKAKAARHLLVTCERLLSGDSLTGCQERADLPGFLVDAVVEAPRGAWPHSCEGEYECDEAFLKAYLAATASDERFAAFLAERVVGK